MNTTIVAEKTTRHTPGPWTPIAADWPDNPAEREQGIVRYYIKHDPPEISMCNAWLIAAAPDLLAALVELERTAVRLGLVRGQDNNDAEWAEALNQHLRALEAARLAIAKAEGAR